MENNSKTEQITQQTSFQKKKVGLVSQKYSEAKEAKVEISQKFGDYIDLYEGRHWKKKTAKWKSQAVENLIFSVIESQLPLMTDRQPEILCLPTTPDDQGKAEALNQMIKYSWEKQDMQMKLVKVIRDQLILGTGIIKVGFNPDLLGGLGDVETHVVDPFDFFPDPNATEMADMEYCIFRTRPALRKLRQQYPDVAHLIQPDSEYEQNDDVRQTEKSDSKGKGNTVTVLEMWYFNDNGEMWISTVANGVLLEDRKSPYLKEDFPFIMFSDHVLTGRFWGIGETEVLAPLQLELNKIRSVVMDNLIANNNTAWIVDRTANVKKNAITNEPGLIIEKSPGGNVQRAEPPSLPSYIQNQMEMTKKSMEEVSGIHDVTKGIASGSVTAASAIQILTENSQTRIRAKLRNAEHSIKKLGEWWIHLMIAFYDETRDVRILGEGNDYDFVPFDAREFRSPDPSILMKNPETGQMEVDPNEVDPETGKPNKEIISEFDIMVSSGSSMLINKNAKYEQALILWQNNVLDPETLLEAAEIGDVKTIIDKLIKYGKLPSPDAPQVDIKSVLDGLGIKFSMSSVEPGLIYDVLQNVEDQMNQNAEVQNIIQQGGVDPNMPLIDNQTPDMPNK